MRNIKEDLLLSLNGKSPISCAQITILEPLFTQHENGSTVRRNIESTVYLNMASTSQEQEAFFSSLDKKGFVTNSSYVWLTDGSWMEVSTEGGRDFWYHCKYPDVPNNLKCSKQKSQPLSQS